MWGVAWGTTSHAWTPKVNQGKSGDDETTKKKKTKRHREQKSRQGFEEKNSASWLETKRPLRCLLPQPKQHSWR